MDSGPVPRRVDQGKREIGGRDRRRTLEYPVKSFSRTIATSLTPMLALAMVGALAAVPFISLTASRAEGVSPPPPRRVADTVPGSYIVVLKGTALRADAVQNATKRLVRAHGGRVRRLYSATLRGFAAEMTAGQARAVAADPEVAYVEQDARHHGAGIQPNPPSWGLDRIDQHDLPLDRSYTYAMAADNVTAYIIDSGLRTSHTQFQGRATIGVDEVGDGRNGADCLGHGTHVAGTVGGRDYGVAKAIKIVAVRVLDCDDSATTSAIIAAADWITANAVRPAVVNMSINGPASASEDTAIRRSIESGLTWSVSSGNAGSDACGNSPGRISQALVVNNANSDDTRSPDSNYGPCTDLFAPGTRINSSWNSGDTATRTISGTSMAAPHVTAAAALWLSAHPDAAPAEVQAALVAAATQGRIRDAGAGTPNRLLFTGTDGSPGSAVVFSDGFESDRGWQRNAAGGDTATAGVLERGVPQQTTSTYSGQVKQLTARSGTFALATGASAGSAYGANDLDGGTTSITSPAIALPTGGPLTLNFAYNIAHGDNSGTDDHLKVIVTADGQTSTVFTRTGAATEVAGRWQTATADLSAFTGKTVHIRLQAADAGTPSLFETEIDDLSITGP
ncbi:S8 family serine peptidase [Actinomadura geliboluensis]|uniref:S8 family serine peptidase n=1 Tax=Actinomadura geliboluensis TaxID=882440 RepID=UPI00197AF426|nr:S8 family serine peptidase [Actinomadura geliboluensis]